MAIEYDVNELKQLVEAKNVDAVVKFMNDHDLSLADNIIEPNDKKYFKERKNYWDLEQYVSKIFLNSSFGSLLQSNSTFYDFRLGSSITTSGRLVVYHLTAKSNELLVGKYDVHGETIEYNDTDSVYCFIGNEAFKQAHPNFDYSRDNIIKFANDVGDKINDSFFEYMKKTYHCSDKGALRIKGGREVVASRGIYVSKKRYALMVYDKDGFRQDTHGKEGSMKIMGLQTQRSDLSMPVRKVLKDMLTELLTSGDKEKVKNILKDFYYNVWIKIKPWNQGSPKPLNKMAIIEDKINNESEYKSGKKLVIPTQIKAAYNFNKLIDYYGDTKTKKLSDGDKVLVCRLNPNNQFRMDTVAISIELGEDAIPQWFKELPFDNVRNDASVDKTVETIFGVLNWDLSFKTLTYQKPDANDMGIMFV